MGYIPRGRGCRSDARDLRLPQGRRRVGRRRARGARCPKPVAALPGAPAPVPVPTPAPTPTPDISTPEGYLQEPPACHRGRRGAHSPGGVLAKDGIDVSRPEERSSQCSRTQGKTIADLAVLAGAYRRLAPRSWASGSPGGELLRSRTVVLKFLKDSPGRSTRRPSPTQSEIAGQERASRQGVSPETHTCTRRTMSCGSVAAPTRPSLTEVFTALP